MVRVTYIGIGGHEQTVEAAPGLSLMEAAVNNGVDGIDAVCGGNCYCGTCRVYVDPQWRTAVGEASEFEAPVVETVGDTAPDIRLSCQITLTEALDGLVVRLPALQT